MFKKIKPGVGKNSAMVNETVCTDIRNSLNGLKHSSNVYIFKSQGSKFLPLLVCETESKGFDNCFISRLRKKVVQESCAEKQTKNVHQSNKQACKSM